eukprot:4614728-Amphidinium_carterae.1
MAVLGTKDFSSTIPQKRRIKNKQPIQSRRKPNVFTTVKWAVSRPDGRATREAEHQRTNRKVPRVLGRNFGVALQVGCHVSNFGVRRSTMESSVGRYEIVRPERSEVGEENPKVSFSVGPILSTFIPEEKPVEQELCLERSLD